MIDVPEAHGMGRLRYGKTGVAQEKFDGLFYSDMVYIGGQGTAESSVKTPAEFVPVHARLFRQFVSCHIPVINLK
jgi:hypothetical protein